MNKNNFQIFSHIMTVSIMDSSQSLFILMWIRIDSPFCHLVFLRRATFQFKEKLRIKQLSPPILIRKLYLNSYPNNFQFLYFATTQLMKIEQNFMTIKPQTRAMSSQDRPVISSGHSSKSDSFHFWKRNSKKSEQRFHEKIKLEKEINFFQNRLEKHELKMEQFSEELQGYKKHSMTAVLKEDKEQRDYWAGQEQFCIMQIEQEEAKIERLYTKLKELKKQLQKLEVKII